MLRVALFYHSLISDWNHGNAHFLRGIASELLALGHQVHVYEPADSWSRSNLIAERGTAAIRDFECAFPDLRSEQYDPHQPDLEAKLDGVHLALVHEWNDPSTITAIGRIRERTPELRLLFHDTHHRAVSAPEELRRLDLSGYDGVLAYGASLQQAYQQLGWGKQVFVWHEAADTRVFYPRTSPSSRQDLVWVGNWGDDERTAELHEYLLDPAERLGLSGSVYGVRYPENALSAVGKAGLRYRGWLANFQVPEVFAVARATVHVPRKPYLVQLPGIPTIRPFEALACAIPLVSAPWLDEENLFRGGTDYLMASSGNQMEKLLRDVLCDRDLAMDLAQHGLETIRSRHTCAHRVAELLAIYGAHKGIE